LRNFERALAKQIKSQVPNLKDITPSLAIEVYKKGKLCGHVSLGKSYRYYDLASLTKIMFTATAWMRWIEKSDFDVNLPVYWFLPWWRHKKTTVQQLLTHSAGLHWWRAYYKVLHGPHNFAHRWPQLQMEVAKGRPKPGVKSVYSDLDLFLLGSLLEELEQKSLPDLWHEIAEEFSLEDVRFHQGNRAAHARKLYAPTEDCEWRGRILQGEVHDENTWALGGVAPHAGLFASLHDVSRWALLLRKALRGEFTGFGSREIVETFTSRRIPRRKGDWGYLFMKPTLRVASCGSYFSARSFGHTGFTGTSVWMDPVHDVIVVILSNRVNPTRENREFIKLRPLLHDWIMELL
jgi:CubicO group peptidase (beta-lactamase class C family)